MTAHNHPTLEWSSLQDVFYRKSEIYQLTWGIDDLSDYLVTSAKNGGLIALYRDPSKVVSIGRNTLLRPKIHVYTSAGQLVESIPWDSSVNIIAFGFNTQEQLAVVIDEGIVRLYTLFQPCPSPPAKVTQTSAEDQIVSKPTEATSNCYYVPYSLGQEATDTGIIDAKLWEDGLVAMTGAGSLVEWKFPKRSEDEIIGGAEAVSHSIVLPPLQISIDQRHLPSAWCIVPPTVSNSGLLEVLISPTSSETVVSLDAVSGAKDMKLSRGPFSAIRPSPNGKLLALLTSDEKLWVVSSDFQRSLSEFDVTQCSAYKQRNSTSSSQTEEGMKQVGIRQIEWCGNNTVAIAWDSEITMIGPFGDSLQYLYPATVKLISELDGLRIISADRLEFIQKVTGMILHLILQVTARS